MDSEDKYANIKISYDELKELVMDCATTIGLLLKEFNEKGLKFDKEKAAMLGNLYDRLEAYGFVDEMLK